MGVDRPSGSSRALRLDPYALPVRYAARDSGADGQVRDIELDRERVVLRREVRGIPHENRRAGHRIRRRHACERCRPRATSRPPSPSCSNIATAGSRVPLFVATEGDDAMAQWKSWGRVLGVPLLVADGDGALREPFRRIGRLGVGAPAPRRRRRAAIKWRQALDPDAAEARPAVGRCRPCIAASARSSRATRLDPKNRFGSCPPLNSKASACRHRPSVQQAMGVCRKRRPPRFPKRPSQRRQAFTSCWHPAPNYPPRPPSTRWSRCPSSSWSAWRHEWTRRHLAVFGLGAVLLHPGAGGLRLGWRGSSRRRVRLRAIAFGAAGQRCLAGSMLLAVGAAHDPASRTSRPRQARSRSANGLEPGVELAGDLAAPPEYRIVRAADEGAPAAPRCSSTAVPRGTSRAMQKGILLARRSSTASSRIYVSPKTRSLAPCSASTTSPRSTRRSPHQRQSLRQRGRVYTQSGKWRASSATTSSREHRRQRRRGRAYGRTSRSPG